MASIEKNAAFTVDYKTKRFDGGEIWVQSSGRAVKWREGKPTRMGGTLIDITQLKTAEEKVGLYYRNFERILESMGDVLIAIDEGGIVQSCNNICQKMFGYTPDEMLGKNVNMIMPSEYAVNHDQYLRNYLKTGVAKVIGIGREVQARRKDGSIFPVDLSVAEVKQGSRRLFIGIIRDITRRKTAEEDLRRSNQELEKFVYVASHDLKAPLRGIDNLAQWVLEDMEGALPPDAREKLGLLRSRVARLEALLAGILSYSRAGRVVEAPEKIDLGALVKAVADLHVPGSFTVEIGDLPVLLTSRTSLEQIFGNLFSNAVKHHDKGRGVIVVTAGDQGAFYEFIVKDDGPGIPPEFHEKVFEMFQTMKPRDQTEGSGLGMPLIKKLVEWQGGRVWIESRANERGTAIHFLWPREFKTAK